MLCSVLIHRSLRVLLLESCSCVFQHLLALALRDLLLILLVLISDLPSTHPSTVYNDVSQYSHTVNRDTLLHRFSYLHTLLVFPTFSLIKTSNDWLWGLFPSLSSSSFLYLVQSLLPSGTFPLTPIISSIFHIHLISPNFLSSRPQATTQQFNRPCRRISQPCNCPRRCKSSLRYPHRRHRWLPRKHR